MKKRFQLRLFAVILLGIAMTYACKKSESMPLNEENLSIQKTSNFGTVTPVNGGTLTGIIALAPTISVSNGWLNFPTMSIFQAAMQQLQSNDDPVSLSNWENGYRAKGFSSLRTFYENNEMDESENRRALTNDSLIKTNQLLDCPDSRFATVITQDGYIQIADTIYSFKPGKAQGAALAIPVRYSSLVRSGSDMKYLQGVKTHYTSFGPVVNYSRVEDFGQQAVIAGNVGDLGGGQVLAMRPSTMPLMPFLRWGDNSQVIAGPIADSRICEYPGVLMPNWWGQKGGDVYGSDVNQPFPEDNGRTVKLSYHRWRVGYIFYASAGIRVKMWKNTRFAGWLSTVKADNIIMEACTKGKIFIPGIPLISFNATTSPGWPLFGRYNTKSFEKTLKWTGSGVFNEIILEHFNFHFKANYKGKLVERTIKE